VAFGEACEQNKVTSFPTIVYYKDGVQTKTSIGVRSLEDLSTWIEGILETIKPGSRPKGGPVLPKVGDKTVAVPKDKGATASVEAAVASSLPKEKKLPLLPLSKETPNPNGLSVTLDAESFQRLVTATRDPWFVKFYAPWCHHCQAMAANWVEMAREMKGVLNIGQVNCEADKRLCKDAKVKGFPTMLFFRGGERIEYNGLRGVGDLVSFAQKGVGAGTGVKEVNFETFKKLEETEEVLFLYFYDDATTFEDFAALERLTLSLIGHGKLVKTDDKELCKRFKISTWPRLVVSRDGKAVYYPYLAPKDMRDYRQILNWMKTTWLPLVPEVTASNAKEIFSNAIVVLGVLSRDRSDEYLAAKREMKQAAIEWIDREAHARQLERQELRDAKQLRMEEAKDRNDERALSRARNTRVELESKQEIKFAWVDGVFWERWIRTTYGIDVADGGEKVVIIDEDVSLPQDKLK
jgi:protein disulfide-isomerase